MEIKIPTREEFRLVYERDMKSAFPPEELKPLYAIEALWDDGVYRPWCMYEGEEIVGCACVWQYEPGWVLFDYLFVAGSRRNDGIGSAIIQKLHEDEAGNVIFGETEIPEYAEDSAMAARRIAFYKRNGYRQAFYDNTLFGVPFHTLYHAEEEIDEKLLLEKHQSIYRNRFGEEAYKRLFNIPWDITMGVPERVLWEDEQ